LTITEMRYLLALLGLAEQGSWCAAISVDSLECLYAPHFGYEKKITIVSVGRNLLS